MVKSTFETPFTKHKFYTNIHFQKSALSSSTMHRAQWWANHGRQIVKFDDSSEVSVMQIFKIVHSENHEITILLIICILIPHLFYDYRSPVFRHSLRSNSYSFSGNVP